MLRIFIFFWFNFLIRFPNWMNFLFLLRLLKVKSMNSGAASLDNGRFAPRFDGLRFIETLITAHRWNCWDYCVWGNDIHILVGLPSSSLLLYSWINSFRRYYTRECSSAVTWHLFYNTTLLFSITIWFDSIPTTNYHCLDICNLVLQIGFLLPHGLLFISWWDMYVLWLIMKGWMHKSCPTYLLIQNQEKVKTLHNCTSSLHWSGMLDWECFIELNCLLW